MEREEEEVCRGEEKEEERLVHKCNRGGLGDEWAETKREGWKEDGRRHLLEWERGVRGRACMAEAE